MAVKHDSARLATVVLAIFCLAMVTDPVLASGAMVGDSFLPGEIWIYKMLWFIRSPLFFYISLIILIGGSFLVWALGFGLIRWIVLVLAYCIIWWLSAIYLPALLLRGNY